MVVWPGYLLHQPTFNLFSFSPSLIQANNLSSRREDKREENLIDLINGAVLSFLG